MKNMPTLVKIGLIVLAIVLLGLAWGAVHEMVRDNLLMLKTQRALLGGSEELAGISAELQAAAAQSCNLYWPAGVVAGRMGDLALQQADWSAFLNCGLLASFPLVHAGAPNNQALAQQAIKIYPDKSEAWFWLAEISAGQGQKDLAIQQYRRVVALDPINALAWCHLGKVLADNDIAEAREAYLNCCYNGDPGSNGCYNAGRLAELQGNLSEAIRIYRYSHWQPARRRADELEKQLMPPP
jgi:tetratricopeptide (TPR) repeat protein